MEQVYTPGSTAMRCMTLTHRVDGSVMRFHRFAWNYYHQQPIRDRLQQWQKAAIGNRFRRIADIREEEDELCIYLPPLPPGCFPLSACRDHLSEDDRIRILVSLTEALEQLHQQRFVLGLFIPEQIYYRKESGSVILDVQPYPNTFPMVDKVLAEYPFALLSPYSRHHTMPRIADFQGIGLLMHWLYLGRFPSEPWTLTDELPAAVHGLCKQLIGSPETFLSAREIGERLVTAGTGRAVPTQDGHLSAGVEQLHPMLPPIMPDEQAALRAFLRREGGRLIGLISQDDASRYHIYNQHFNEVMERHIFIMINCRPLPFSTLRELSERTIQFAARMNPRIAPSLQRMWQRFERILSQHYTGREIVHTLAEWLYKLYREVQPVTQPLHFFYTLEDCELCDEDSQRVFLHFWETYGEELHQPYVLFSGKQKPAIMTGDSIRYLEFGQKTAAMYRHVLLSQLGRADDALVEKLARWFCEQQIDFAHTRLILESLVEKGHLVLTPAGWRDNGMPELDIHAPSTLIASRLAKLSPEDLDLLRTLICFPHPVRAETIFRANGADTEELWMALSRFDQWGLASVYSPNSVYVPVDVARQALYDLPYAEQSSYYERALQMQQAFRPTALPQLIELALLAGNKRLEYFYLIRYYRQIRSKLKLDGHKTILENLKRLQHELMRRQILCWDRLLYQVYLRLNLYEQAEATARDLYKRTGEAYDRFCLLSVLLFTQQLDLPAAKQELLTYLEDKRNRLSDRARAAHLLCRLNLFSPITREGAEKIDRFFREEFYPSRALLSRRLYADFTLFYVILAADYFQELEERANALRQSLETMLETYPYHDLLLDLYNSYLFQPNVKIAHMYNQRQLTLSRRFGFTTKEQISYLNGMEIALILGDPAEYRYLLNCLLQAGELKRSDLREYFLQHQMLYAVEWMRWELYQQVENELLQLNLSDAAFTEWEMVSRYAAFRRGEPLPPPTVWHQQNDATLFIDALYEIERGETERAVQLFKQAIASNGYRIYQGWAMRELIALLLREGSAEAEYWLEQWKHYLHAYGYDLFWPDYYRFIAIWYLRSGDRNRSLLSLLRAANIYQLIEKEEMYHEIMAEIEHLMKPAYLEGDPGLREHPQVQCLLQERQQLLHHSLDLQIIMQLSEQVTGALEITRTLHRLTHALFEYFPVTLLAVDFQLLFRKEKIYYRASGTVIDNVQISYTTEREGIEKYVFPLYQQGSQSIMLELYSPALPDTKRAHIEHFLSFIRPHIANAVLYMEMMIDNLTGFYQRRYFMERLQQEFILAKRYDLDLSVIMLDIDNFRLINEFGHQEGDRVLRELADIVRGILRQNDVPGRYGGEELLLVLPKTDGQTALKIAREIRKQIEEGFAARNPYKVTVSVGVSTLAHCQAETIDDLIRLADDAEIAAKKSGKNRVVAAW
ncbi:GGDEF domain-containing protein [Brevibacillus sp. SYP-B805]|uniref:GGDEF domain-containing protein n=1 Tax=Brevibacillus sp. SYP-B805 TaxID=1578199 RepID=UPI0013EC23A8|nr:GGDEF domain-containing protein [Brevibacillus sp. SYP-B805]NGQ95378.1 GGDEF domain-containing protein [Brevibacillus sp. SYP-B805]